MALKQPTSIVDMIESLPAGRALCALNVETFDTISSVLSAGAAAGTPVVLGVSVPVAKTFGYRYLVEFAALEAGRFDTEYALHLDHAEDARDVVDALGSGFGSANFLDEGGPEHGEYEQLAMNLREDHPDAALEFIWGHLGHAEDSAHEGAGASTHDDHAPTLERIVEFSSRTRPTILGYDMGSLHGMTARTQSLDIELIRRVHASTSLPLVLHGASGVRHEEITLAIDSGVKKVNVETAVRAAYISAAREALAPGGVGGRKPRVLASFIAQAIEQTMKEYLLLCTAPSPLSAETP